MRFITLGTALYDAVPVTITFDSTYSMVEFVTNNEIVFRGELPAIKGLPSLSLTEEGLDVVLEDLRKDNIVQAVTRKSESFSFVTVKVGASRSRDDIYQMLTALFRTAGYECTCQRSYWAATSFNSLQFRK